MLVAGKTYDEIAQALGYKNAKSVASSIRSYQAKIISVDAQDAQAWVEKQCIFLEQKIRELSADLQGFEKGSRGYLGTQKLILDYSKQLQELKAPKNVTPQNLPQAPSISIDIKSLLGQVSLSVDPGPDALGQPSIDVDSLQDPENQEEELEGGS